MLEAVILGVRGVMVPTAAFEHAGIEAAAAVLATLGVCPRSFRRAARRRLDQDGPVSLISRTINDLELRLTPGAVRPAVLAAREARPPCERDPQWQAVLSELGRRFRLALLDAGCADSLEGLREALGLAQLRALWTEKLGTAASPPSPLAFRWLARCLDVRPSGCLHVAGTRAAWNGARRAGCRLWPRELPAGPSIPAVAPWELLEWIDGGEGTQ